MIARTDEAVVELANGRNGEASVQALRVIDLPEDRPVLALELPEQTSFDEWVAIGRRLCLGQQALNWHIGDWWAFGDHRYGERAKAAAEGIFGREFQTFVNLANVSRKFESNRRRLDLSFSHHAEVAPLPAEEAEQLLERAEREHLSTRDLRREVQALKAANDPESASGEPVEVQSKLVPAQSWQSMAVNYAEGLIEVAGLLDLKRPLTWHEKRRVADLVSEAVAFVEHSRGGSDTVNVPDNFDVIFVERGRIACEEFFKKSRVTINHWLIARGKRRLIEDRAAFVRFQRDQEAAVASKPERRQDSRTIGEVLHPIAKHAAHFLRVSRYGGWRVSPAPDGGWFVGTVRKTDDELIAMAERQGFDPEAYRAVGEEA